MSNTTNRLFCGVATGLFLVLSAAVPGVSTVRARVTAPAHRSIDRQSLSAPSTQSLNLYQRGRVEAYLAGTRALTLDTLRVAVFQVQFQDSLMGGQPGSHRPELRDSTWFGNELKHLRSYFDGASRGRFTVSWTLDGKLYTLPNGMGYYGNDKVEEVRVVELVRTLVDSATTQTDFSQFDHVFVIHAGAGQETDLAGDSQDQIWSSFYDRGDIDAAYPDSSVSGIATGDSLGGQPFFVDNFSIVPANSSQDFSVIGTLGIWAFEIGNRVGLLPTFDSTPAGAIDSQGIGDFDLMAFGLFNVNGFIPSFPSALNRVIAGWIDPVTIDAEPTARTIGISDINTGSLGDTLCVRVPITESEYYLVVNRVHDANFDSLFSFTDLDTDLIPDNDEPLDGAEFDFFLTDLTNPFQRRTHPVYGPGTLFRYTGSGVYIWHVDEGVIRSTIDAGFLPNDFADRKGVDLEEADGVQDLDEPGAIAFALGSHWDSFRSGDNNADRFGPSTSPASLSNAGIATGIIVEDISVPGPQMQVTLRRDATWSETRARFAANTWNQPATPVDIDGVAGQEIVILADTGTVYVFDMNAVEFVDGDSNPVTIEPWIVAPGAEWVGPPAFGNLDGGGDTEIIASSTAGDVYAWKSNGAEVTDGDGDAGTSGVLYRGLPMATPPMLVDLEPDGTPEIVITERSGDTLRVSFVDNLGAARPVVDPSFSGLWPVTVVGQRAMPLVAARVVEGTQPARVGVAVAALDTLTARLTLSFTPFAWTGTPTGSPTAVGWVSTIDIGGVSGPAPVSPLAAGDIDGDGSDEIVFTLADGRLVVAEGESGALRITRLRSSTPSAPALGDVDGDGTHEIALWDRDYLYLLKSNGRDMLDWPKRIVSAAAPEQPPLSIHRGYESPVIGDITGNGRVDIVYHIDDGSVYSFRADATATRGFPRVSSAGPATPAISDLDGDGELSLILAGAVSSLRAVDSVADTVATQDAAALSIQSLGGSDASGALFWPLYGAGLDRTGRPIGQNPLLAASRSFDEASFMIYPNPVPGSMVHARLTLNGPATVSVHIYNYEGEEAFARTYSANPGGAIDTPFDEEIDVSRLVSGVYFMRLRIEGSSGAGSIVKPFAIRR